MSRVLLTGATGFIGSRAIGPLLRRGHEIHSLSRQPARTRDVTWHTVDLLDPAKTRAVVHEIKAEALLHFAWYTEHQRYWTATENLAWVGATLSLLSAFGDSGGARAVLVGTCAEYLWGESVPCSETTTPLRPASLYGVAKHSTHTVASAYAQSIGLQLAWGRIFSCYGPGEDHRRFVPAVTRALLAGCEAKTGDGTRLRDFMHVDDVALGFVALLDSAVNGPVNIASGCDVQLATVAETIAATVGRPDLLRVGVLPVTEADPPAISADVTRLRREVRFQPSVGLRDGIGRTVEWWKSRPQ